MAEEVIEKPTKRQQKRKQGATEEVAPVVSEVVETKEKPVEKITKLPNGLTVITR